MSWDLSKGIKRTPKPLPDPRQDMRPPSHRDGPDTERLAAALARPRAGTWRARVLAFMIEAGPVTDWDLMRHFGRPHNSIGPRRNELVKLGWVYDTGKRAPSFNDGSTADAIVWDVTPQGREEWTAA